MSGGVVELLVVKGEDEVVSSGLLSVERAPPALRLPALKVRGRRGKTLEEKAAAPKFILSGRAVKRRSEKLVVKRAPSVFSSSK